MRWVKAGTMRLDMDKILFMDLDGELPDKLFVLQYENITCKVTKSPAMLALYDFLETQCSKKLDQEINDIIRKQEGYGF